MNPRAYIFFIGLLLLFVVVRLPGLSVPYQQDEFKTAIAAESSLSAASVFLTHPPLTAMLFRADALAFGGEQMRIMPLLFGLLSAILLFYVVRHRFNERAALWSVFLYAVSFYGIWASLMLDTDGAILPTLFLAAVYCYDRAKSSAAYARRWLFLLVLTLITGLLVKLSFILVVGVFIADFLFERRRELSAAHLVHFGAFGLSVVVFTVVAFVLIKALNPAFSIGGMISHALYYVQWSGRSYLQIIVQSLKAVFYLSPLLIVPLLCISKDIVRRTTPFLWYLGLGFVFYFILFDFSHGALDKYLMFTIVPLAVMSGAILSELFATFSVRKNPIATTLGVLSAAAIVSVLLVPPDIVPLHPKTAWFTRVVHGDWNMLTAFNGGSGPVGFYVSFLVIAATFIIAGASALVARINKTFIPIAALIIVFSGLAYNAVFAEEFSFGKAYGNVSEALEPALAYIATDTAIHGVLTYNDIGAYELKHMSKYTARFYAAPQFEAVHRIALPAHTGAFLVVDIPPLYGGFYRDFFESCKILFTARSGLITSTVYVSCTWTKE